VPEERKRLHRLAELDRQDLRVRTRRAAVGDLLLFAVVLVALCIAVLTATALSLIQDEPQRPPTPTM
jgi:hypothetical protein